MAGNGNFKLDSFPRRMVIIMDGSRFSMIERLTRDMAEWLTNEITPKCHGYVTPASRDREGNGLIIRGKLISRVLGKCNRSLQPETVLLGAIGRVPLRKIGCIVERHKCESVSLSPRQVRSVHFHRTCSKPRLYVRVPADGHICIGNHRLRSLLTF